MTLSFVTQALSPNKEERILEEAVDSKNIALTAGAASAISAATGNYELAQGSALIAGTAAITEMQGTKSLKNKVKELRRYADCTAETLDQELEGRYISRVDGDNKEVVEDERVIGALQSWANTGENQYQDIGDQIIEVSEYSEGQASVAVYEKDSKRGMNEIDAVVQSQKGLF